MREHSNLAIFARANLKKHERLKRAKMLLITRGGRITCGKTKSAMAEREGGRVKAEVKGAV